MSPGALGLKPVLHDKDTAAPALFGSYLYATTYSRLLLSTSVSLYLK